MSTYTHRYYEVKVPIIDQILQNKDDEIVPEKELYDGYTVKVYFDDKQYRIWNEKKQEWVKSDTCRTKWVLAKWFANPEYGYSPQYHDVEVGKVIPAPKNDYEYHRTPLAKVGDKLSEYICYCDNGGIIRDEFISGRGWSEHEWGFAERGFPDDMSDELRQEFNKDMEYTWGHTYVLLSEWNDAFDKMKEEFKAKVLAKVQETQYKEIDKKLGMLLKKAENPEYKIPKPKKKKDDEEEIEYYEDSMKYLWNETFWDLMAIHSEIGRAYDYTEWFGYQPANNIRIVYYLS